MDLPSKDPLMNIADLELEVELLEDHFVLLENWMDNIVFQRTIDGDLVALGQINCLLPSKPFEAGVLSDGFVGITVLEVFIEEIHERMTHQKWSILKCGFSGDSFLSETINHFA